MKLTPTPPGEVFGSYVWGSRQQAGPWVHDLGVPTLFELWPAREHVPNVEKRAITGGTCCCAASSSNSTLLREAVLTFAALSSTEGLGSTYCVQADVNLKSTLGNGSHAHADNCT